ncbi:hypothetical protein B0T16DRAFT_63407 [Cercophora newfieldiana]|uniref:Uncharacterized protein n=1 Tax=Cercophora newfieldiana TaxID=92897 RepID=A0AA39YS03_9PEZI|nr:hypothetical protein B0T16DRAFT_63407 [Cercophora newfieldiana]
MIPGTPPPTPPPSSPLGVDDYVRQEFNQQSPAQARAARGRVVDDGLIEFLEEYSRSANALPKLRHWLQDQVLAPVPQGTNRGDFIEYHLRNPEVGNYDAGSEFFNRLRGYRFINNWIEPDDKEFAQIPDAYRPSPNTPRPQPSTRIAMAFAGDSKLKRLQKKLDRWTQKPAAMDLGEEDEDLPFQADDDNADVFAWLSTASHANFKSGAPPPDPAAAPLAHSFYKDRKLQPLVVLLGLIKNFLADQDVDRCKDWGDEFDKLAKYLQWLAEEDTSDQLGNASETTRALFDEVVAMMKTHTLFERHKHGIKSLEIPPPPTVPQRSTRLDWAGAVHDWPGASLEPAIPKRDLPRPLCPRDPVPVNTMPSKKSDNPSAWDSFVRDTAHFWSDNTASGAPDSNLARIEAQTFDEYLKRGYTQGVARDKNTGLTVLPDPDRTMVYPGDKEGWAKERGARRAGFLTTLRYYDAKEQRGLATSLGRISLPLSPQALKEARDAPRRPQWDASSLPRHKMPAQLETQPFLFYYRDYLQNLRPTLKTALATAQSDYASHVALPPNLAVGGPFTRRCVDWRTQQQENLMARCQKALQMLQEAKRHAPRDLLNQMIDVAEACLNGELYSHESTQDIQLTDDQWDSPSAGPVSDSHYRIPRQIDDEDIRWIKFLASDGASDAWTGGFTPDTPKDKYRLFLIFATRVKKLLDDRNPDGLFSDFDKEVSVEQLLAVLNAGVGSSPVDKVEFGPYDAMAWLTRLRDSGHIQFREDISCYGVIRRPDNVYHPEDRVFMDGSPRRPSFEAIQDWDYVIGNEIHANAQVHNFFKALALRLGYTIWVLKQALKSSPPFLQPRASELVKSIDKWKKTCTPEGKGDLIKLVKSIDSQANVDKNNVLPWLREKIINEINANDTMLAPGRERHFTGGDGLNYVVLVRDHNWEWASERVRGRTVPRFMDVNRWPQGHGYLSSDDKLNYDADERVDPALIYDPSAQDPINLRFFRPRLRRYGEDRDDVRWRPGRPIFPVGDTRRQQRVIEQYMTSMVNNAIGMEEPQPTWGSLFSGIFNPVKRLLPFNAPKDDDGMPPEHPPLPPVDRKYVPKSWDPERERTKRDALEKKRAARQERRGGWKRSKYDPPVPDEMDLDDDDSTFEGPDERPEIFYG